MNVFTKGSLSFCYLCLAVAIVCISPSIARGDTIDIPMDYPTIGEGIENASSGDTVLVDDGTYYETIDLQGKAIVLLSRNGPLRTVIDGNNAGSVISIKTGEPLSCVVDGFTIRNGSGTGGFLDTRGGGLYIVDASPTIRGNILSDNSVKEKGGGIYCSAASPELLHNVIHHNTCIFGRGAGIACEAQSNPLIFGNVIRENTDKNTAFEGGGISVENSEPILVNNIIMGNRAPHGGGVYLYNSSIQLLNNTIAENEATSYFGGGVYVNECAPVIKHNVLSNNRANHGAGVYADIDGFPVFIHNLFWNNDNDDTYGCEPGEDDLFDDPLFTGGPFGEFYLSQIKAGQSMNSPCLDYGTDPAHSGGFDTLTTRTDEVVDTEMVDIGFHYIVLSPRLTLTLQATPSQVIRCSYISWSFILENLSLGKTECDLWVEIKGPLPRETIHRIPVRKNILLNPGDEKKYGINAFIPVRVPLGDYLIKTAAGEYPTLIYASSQFECEVIWNGAD
jgi:predicted outer membrane repeat protein